MGLAPKKLSEPDRWVIYGVEGVGKTSLVADMPDVVMFDIEGGSGYQSVARYPFRDGPGGHRPLEYSEVLAAIRDLGTSQHKFKSLAIDTLDTLESLLWKHLCATESKASGKLYASIEDFGYGKGLTKAVDEWRALAALLDRLRAAKGMQIALVGHSQIRTFKNPEGEDYDRYNLRLDARAAGFLKEWPDHLGFMQFEDFASKLSKDDTRARGVSTGNRLIRFSRTAAYDAKSRVKMPAEIILDGEHPWATVQAAIAESQK